MIQHAPARYAEVGVLASVPGVLAVDGLGQVRPHLLWVRPGHCSCCKLHNTQWHSDQEFARPVPTQHDACPLPGSSGGITCSGCVPSCSCVTAIECVFLQGIRLRSWKPAGPELSDTSTSGSLAECTALPPTVKVAGVVLAQPAVAGEALLDPVAAADQYLLKIPPRAHV